MRRYSGDVTGEPLHPGGQGDTYKVTLGQNKLVLKVYKGQREGQLRLRDLSDTLDMMTDMPAPLARGRMIDCGSAYSGIYGWPAALFNFVEGKVLCDPIGHSECALRSGVVPNPARLKLATELLESVHYLHSKGIIHADLAPSNVLVNDSVPELTIIDIDGAGVLATGGSLWKRPPLVLGHGGLPDFPAPSEYWDGGVTKETDYWWSQMLTYFILTSTPPFFFLTLLSPRELHEVGELLSTAKRCWPPEYDQIKRHSKFNHNIAENDYREFAESIQHLVPTGSFFNTFGFGYSRPKFRVSPGYLLRQMVGG